MNKKLIKTAGSGSGERVETCLASALSNPHHQVSENLPTTPSIPTEPNGNLEEMVFCIPLDSPNLATLVKSTITVREASAPASVRQCSRT